MTDHSSHPVIARFDRVLEEAVGRIEDSPFVKDLAAGHSYPQALGRHRCLPSDGPPGACASRRRISSVICSRRRPLRAATAGVNVGR